VALTISPVQPTGLQVHLNVLRALILRDMRSRFGRGVASYLVAVCLPLIHLLSLMLIPLLVNHISPLGTDFALFAATGVLPYILCLYPSRMIMLCLVDSGPLLSFPVVKPLDVIMARGILEVVIGFTVMLMFVVFLLVFDVEVWPYDIAQATGAIFSCLYLGLAIGFVSAILFKLFRAWMFIQIALLIFSYMVSGAFILPSMLPAEYRELMWFNPLLHCIEWLRVAYYEGYTTELLSRKYVLGFATVLLWLGLVFERLIRGRLMMA